MIAASFVKSIGLLLRLSTTFTLIFLWFSKSLMISKFLFITAICKAVVEVLSWVLYPVCKSLIIFFDVIISFTLISGSDNKRPTILAFLFQLPSVTLFFPL